MPGTRVAQELLSFSDPQLRSKGLAESPKWEAQSLQAVRPEHHWFLPDRESR